MFWVVVVQKYKLHLQLSNTNFRALCQHRLVFGIVQKSLHLEGTELQFELNKPPLQNHNGATTMLHCN